MFIGLGLGLNSQQPASGGAVAGTTWNAAASGADFVFSNGNLTASRTTGAGDQIAKGSVARTSGYWELLPTISGGNAIAGFATAGTAVNDYLGDAATALGWVNSGAVLINNITVATYATFVSTDILGLAIKASKAYLGKWNGSSMTWQGGADPSAGTGGLDVSAFIGSGLLPAASINNNTNTLVGRFTTGFSGAIPTGLTAWS